MFNDRSTSSADRTSASTGTDREETFAPSALAIGAARRFVATVVASDDGSEDGERLALVTSELASNAVLHVGGEFTVSVRMTPSRRSVRIAVRDRSAVAPMQSASDAGAVTGRGLAIVDALADRWGVDDAIHPSGKWVWAELALHPGSN